MAERKLLDTGKWGGALSSGVGAGDARKQKTRPRIVSGFGLQKGP